MPLDGTEWARLSKDLSGPSEPRRGWFFWAWLGLPVVLIAAALLWTANWTSDDALVRTESVEEQKSTIKPDTPEIEHSGVSEESGSMNLDQPEVATPTEDDADKGQETTNRDIREAPALVRTEPKSERIEKPTEIANNPGNEEILNSDNGDLNNSLNNQDQADLETSTNAMDEPDVTSSDVSLDLNSKTPQIPVNMTTPELISLLGPFKWKMPAIKPLGPSIEAYAGVTFNQPAISGEADVVDYRNVNERGGIGFTVGANLTAQKRSWKYGAGIKADVQQTQYNNQLKILIYDSIPFIDQNLDTTWVPWNFRDTTLDASSFSGPRRTYVGIPIYFGRSMKVSPRVGVNAVVMVQPRVLVGATGDYMSGANSFSELNTSAYAPFQLQYGARIGLDYYWRRNILIFTELNYANDLTNQTKQNNVTERVQVSGMRVGLRFHLN
jgi:hypothetical protein